ncbi:protein of unknown function [Robiginitalea myxolifaciens]|uniref:DUF4249 domain-containing protein n=1 Tax=Robiginitalea myxolifaciens TaxID=400055 RepID=A0A1I6H5A0_9FLAO|nr:DUF4249 family protein [Robiginitalea myxolifaciens]SFR49605.1 protein of unknown function [Robiginitalea myxolifaciens]
MKKENATKGVLLVMLCLLGLIANSCEDVIEIEVPTEPPRLVVEGLIRVDVDQQFAPVEIRLTQTAGFFEEVQLVTDVDEIFIILQQFENGVPNGMSGRSSLAQSSPGSGIYIPDPTFDEDQRIAVDSITQNDILYTLVIEWRGRRYAAQTRYVPTVPLDDLAQGDRTLFDDEQTEVVVEFTDNGERDDFYLFDFGFGNFLPSEDTFYQGQQFSFSYFYDEIFEPGTELTIGILGADQEFYNYMNLLVGQAESDDGPFQTPVATVRGNVFDVTDLDNIDDFDNANQAEIFPLGYFAVVQEFTANITIE